MRRLICMAALSTLLALPATAGERIYTWVDAQGVTHFSEELPDDRSENDVEVLHTDDLVPAIIRDEPAPDHYSVVNQAKRMEQQRLARESEQAAAAEAEREAALIEAQTAAAEAAARRDAAAAKAEPPGYLLVNPPPQVFLPPRLPLPAPVEVLPESTRTPHAVERLADGPGQTAQRPQRSLHRIDVRAHGPYPGNEPPPLLPW